MSNNKLTIKETINNMIDELSRARDILAEIDNDNNTVDYIRELGDDIDNTLLDELEHFNERIDLALLMSAAVGDVAIPTCEQIYEVEANYDLPMYDGLIDTETIYNTIDDIVKDTKCESIDDDSDAIIIKALKVGDNVSISVDDILWTYADFDGGIIVNEGEYSTAYGTIKTTYQEYNNTWYFDFYNEEHRLAATDGERCIVKGITGKYILLENIDGEYDEEFKLSIDEFNSAIRQFHN